MANENNGIVILGAGIIGCSTAYWLTELADTPTTSIHLVDSAPELFASASGKAAGFLASDWFGPATASLGALSFKLHRQLADQYDGRRRWGYSSSTGTSLVTDGRIGGPRGDDWLRTGSSRAEVAAVHDFDGPQEGPAWLTRRKGDTIDVISQQETTAQVDPLRLSQFLLEHSTSKGVQVHQPARAVKVVVEGGQITGVVLRTTTSGEDTTIPCNRILITAGVWTGRVFDELFPHATVDLQVGSLAGHSVVVESPRWTTEHETSGCHAVFTTQPSGFSPEIFSRIGGEIYVAGLNDATLEVPELATDAVPNDICIAELMELSQRLLGKDGTDVSDLKLKREGLCFRPVTAHGNPLLCRIDDKHLGADLTDGNSGVFVSTGHGPWGISQSIGTGKVMAEMLENKPLSADVSRLKP